MHEATPPSDHTRALDGARQAGTSGGFLHTHALAVALQEAAVVAPHTGRPWTEAMLLGLGGGLSAGSLLWQFPTHNAAVLTLGFHHRWNEPEVWYRQALERVGVDALWQYATSPRRASRALDSALRRGRIALCWLDEQRLPYLHVPEAFEGCFAWVAPIVSSSAGAVQVHECWGRHMIVERGRFDEGRDRLVEHRHRMLTIVGAGDAPSLEQAVRAAVSDHVSHQSVDSTSVGLPSLREWAKSLGQGRGRRQWSRIFADRRRLASVFRSMYEGVVARGVDGTGLRGMYAEFLREAGGELQSPHLEAAAEIYDAAAARWSRLAHWSLAAQEPDHPFSGHDVMLEFHRALRERFEALQAGDPTLIAEASARLADINRLLDDDPPWSVDEQTALFMGLSEQLQALWLTERRAASMLRRWLDVS